MLVSATARSEGRKSTSQLAKQDLSACRKDLLELMQRVNFGRIEGLNVDKGDPVLDPRPSIVREHRFSGENGPRPELGSPDFQLKQQVIELFALLDQIGDGVIETLEVKHGLPFRVFLREDVA